MCSYLLSRTSNSSFMPVYQCGDLPLSSTTGTLNNRITAQVRTNNALIATSRLFHGRATPSSRRLQRGDSNGKQALAVRKPLAQIFYIRAQHYSLIGRWAITSFVRGHSLAIIHVLDITSMASKLIFCCLTLSRWSLHCPICSHIRANGGARRPHSCYIDSLWDVL